MPHTFTLHRPTEDDWQAIRDLRIRAVADSPNAFLETLEQALAVEEEGWRSRARRNVAAGSTQIVAVAPDGRWVGSMICFVSDGPPHYVERREPPDRRANLVGVFVDPDWRGAVGVTDALLAVILEWVVREQGLTQLYLHVNAVNERARRSYESRGFRTTGFIDPIPNEPDDLEVEMVLDVPDQSR